MTKFVTFETAHWFSCAPFGLQWCLTCLMMILMHCMFLCLPVILNFLVQGAQPCQDLFDTPFHCRQSLRMNLAQFHRLTSKLTFKLPGLHNKLWTACQFIKLMPKGIFHLFITHLCPKLGIYQYVIIVWINNTPILSGNLTHNVP